MKTRSGFVSNSSSSSFIMMVKQPVNDRNLFYKNVLKCTHADDVVEYTTVEIHEKTIPTPITAEMVYNYAMNREYDASIIVRLKSELRNMFHDYIYTDYRTNKYVMATYMDFNESGEYIQYRYKTTQNICGVKVNVGKIVKQLNNNVSSDVKDKWKYHSVMFNWYTRKEINKICKKILAKYPYTFVTSLSDEDGWLGSFLEHRFDWEIPHIKVSHH